MAEGEVAIRVVTILIIKLSGYPLGYPNALLVMFGDSSGYNFELSVKVAEVSVCLWFGG